MGTAIAVASGGSTLSVVLAGIGALAIGALAVWWGGRKRPAADPRP